MTTAPPSVKKWSPQNMSAAHILAQSLPSDKPREKKAPAPAPGQGPAPAPAPAPGQVEPMKLSNKREEANLKMSERYLVGQLNQNPFMIDHDYLADLEMQNQFLRPQTNFKN
jgi:hypothetical protein